MSLSKYKKSKFKANRVFTDRDEPRRIFWHHFDQLVNGDYFKVLVYYGMGGIGKTSLQNHLMSEVEKQNTINKVKKVHQISVSLDAFEFDSPTDILIAIRKQLTIPAFLFDYALLTYWSAVGHTPIEIKKRMGNDSGLILDIIEEVSGVGGLRIPIKMVKSVGRKLIDRYNKSYGQYKEELEDIESSQPIDIFRKLPYFLGLAIHNAYVQQGIKHIIYFDAYETMLKKLKTKSVTESADEWIREFVASSEAGLFIFGSREAIQWDKYNPEWSEFIQNVDLDVLDESYADEFLTNVPIPDENIRKEIIHSAKGIPLYLNLCVNIYEQKVSSGRELISDDFKMAEYQVIERFLRHLSDEEAELVKALSALHFFDYSLFAYLIKKFHIGYSLTKYEEFLQKSFVLCIDQDYGIYKIHDSIREYIFDGVANTSKEPSELSKNVIRSLFNFTSSYKEKYDLPILVRYFSQLISLMEHIEDFSREEIEELTDTGLFLSDNGYWNDVEQLSLHGEVVLPIKYPFYFLQANCLLWKGKLTEGLNVINKAELSYQKLGKFHVMAEYVKTHITALSGRYDEAEVMYENLTKQISYSRESEKLYSKIYRQWGDLLYLRGKYNKAVEVLDETANQTYNIFEKAATIRTKGHVYRLNFLSDEAEEIYRSALMMFEGERTEGYIGKSHTSLMETLCWSMPEEAIQLAPKAIEINEIQQSKIELGRIYAALAIAYVLHNQDLEHAIEYAELANKTQQETGFQSGVLFSLIAKAMITLSKGNPEEISAAKNVVEEKVEQLKVYHCLKLPIYVYLGDEEAIEKLKTELDWIDFDQTLESVRSIINRLL